MPKNQSVPARKSSAAKKTLAAPAGNEILAKIAKAEQKRRAAAEALRKKAEEKQAEQRRISIAEVGAEYSGYVTLVEASGQRRAAVGMAAARGEMQRSLARHSLHTSIGVKWPTLTTGAVQYLYAMEENRKSVAAQHRRRAKQSVLLVSADAEKKVAGTGPPGQNNCADDLMIVDERT